jgi:hypothetical protein
LLQYRCLSFQLVSLSYVVLICPEAMPHVSLVSTAWHGSLHEITNDNGAKVRNLLKYEYGYKYELCHLLKSVRSTKRPYRNIQKLTRASLDGKVRSQIYDILIDNSRN